ncbi:MAG: Protein translocase subunit SecD [uncultured Propionibacteriaceae bacterium]|uniref:Protein translocase subunit SecD n=1 Tax=uncultured Propionibacteriaceae bacterium TaxID=257457 RepID=A0A6J4MY89_9ACTN|nr:MAG: Protein translocase subunit SecD [uncultured Propionibacteriaceae bacterium]
MATASGRPGRTLIVLTAIVAALFGAMALGDTWTPKLGLDLRGGTTITLTAANTSGGGSVDPTSLQLARTIIQSRVDSLGVGESEVTTAGDKQIIVSVPNVQQDELVRLVGQTAVLRFRAVYAAEPVAPPVAAPSDAPTASADPSGNPSGQPSSQTTPGSQQSAEAPDGPSASPTGNGRPLPQLPTAPPAPKTPRPTEAGKGIPPDQAIEWQPSEADQADFAEFSCDDEKMVDVADQPLFACNKEKTEKYLLGPTLIEGDQLTSASAGVPQNNVQWVVNLEFNAEGGAAFAKATAALAQRTDPQNRFAIVLDGESISAPSVSASIPGGQAEISGNFNQKSATELANVLKYGALPLAFDVSEVANVSATLGGEQLRAGIVAGLIGLGLVLAFSFAYYRGLGIVVVASLAVAGAMTYAVMVLLGSSVGFALNLPGIAGAIVAIGVTADSFVIFFERIRDEVRDGRSLRTAVEAGWRRARQTVLIADAVSMLSAVILFILAIGSVKGFAFTLGLTTLIDVVVVFWFTKPLMTMLARTKFFGGGHRLSGLDPGHLGVPALPGTRARRGAAVALDTGVKEA